MHAKAPISAKERHKAKRRGGYSTRSRCHMLGRECPEAVLRDRALYFPIFSHLLIINKLLSLSLSLSLPFSLSLPTLRNMIHLLPQIRSRASCEPPVLMPKPSPPSTPHV